MATCTSTTEAYFKVGIHLYITLVFPDSSQIVYKTLHDNCQQYKTIYNNNSNKVV